MKVCLPRSSLHSAVSIVIFCGMAAIAHGKLIQEHSSQSGETQSVDKLPPLEPGKPIERELAGGQTHSYRVCLAVDQYVKLVVAQRGIDVVVTMSGPDGKRLAEVDSPNGTQGPEPVSLVAEVGGSYRLDVRSLEKAAAAGRYEVRIEELRAGTPQDSSRVAAERAFAEGERLRAQATAESKRRSIEKYAQAVELRRSIGDSRGEAEALNTLGEVCFSLGETRKALDFLSQALPLCQAVGDRKQEAVVLNNVGAAYDELGEKQKALDYFERAVPIFRAVGDRQGEAAALNYIGKVYNNVGERQRAIDYYRQSLALRLAVGDRRGEAITLQNIGTAYDELGDKQKALDYYSQALPLFRAVGHRQGEAYALNNIGGAYSSLGEKRKALDYFSQALQLRRAVGDRRGEATTLNYIGTVYSSLGETQKALDYFHQALPLRRAVADSRGEAYTLHNIGKTYQDLGDVEKALEHYRQALSLRRAVGDRSGEAITLAGLARLERNRGNLGEARALIESALRIIESLRAKVLSVELRATYLASVWQVYASYIDLLQRLHEREPSKGFNALALHASERARARSLLELLSESRADIRQGVDPSLVERERSLQQLINAKADRQIRLLSGRQTEEQAAVAREVEALTKEYEQVEAQIRATSPRYAALTQPQPLSLAEIQQQVLDRDTLLLEYALGEEKSFLWAVTSDSLKSYELPRRSEIETAARRVYDLLAARNRLVKFETKEQRRARVAQADSEYPKVALALSQILLGPVAGDLGKKRLLTVSDGALQYVPFAALPDPSAPGVPLMVHHELVSLPAASILAVLRRELAGRGSPAKALAVLADPVFEKEDERVRGRIAAKKGGLPPLKVVEARGSEAGVFEGELVRSARDAGLAEGGELRIPRLPYTRREAKSILALAPAQQRKGALDFEASRAMAMSSELGQYRFVHFATHGFLNSQHPELSGIVLSLVDKEGSEQEGFLPATEVFNLELPVELVVLSGCQTGLGKEIRGEGLVGLTRGFLYAGAARVVVSLWDVHDEATAELMTRFYRGMLKNGLSPAAALRASQVSICQEKRWQAPYYWAPFVLQGEPR